MSFGHPSFYEGPQAILFWETVFFIIRRELASIPKHFIAILVLFIYFTFE